MPEPIFLDMRGRLLLDGTSQHDIEQMSQPVQCRHCGGVYDLGKVEVTARYADCSVWKTPCCNHTADDRGETGWKSFSDYTRIQLRPGREADNA